MKTFHQVDLRLCLGIQSFSCNVVTLTDAQDKTFQLHSEERALLNHFHPYDVAITQTIRGRALLIVFYLIIIHHHQQREKWCCVKLVKATYPSRHFL